MAVALSEERRPSGDADFQRAELARLLDSGPFPPALRAAINASGLSLDRIQHRLRGRGVRISVATLSYWQSGRRRPERPESLQALAHLEAVLRVAPAALSSLLGPPRPRGRRGRAATLPPLHAMWSQRGHAAELLAGVDTSDDPLLSRLSQYDSCVIDAGRRQRTMRSRHVLRAEADGPDRWVLVYDWEGPPQAKPAISKLRNCRLGRVATHPASSLLVAELLFEQPLGRGETLIIEYELNGSRGIGGDSHGRKFRLPVREYVLEVRFDPAELPTRCLQFASPSDDALPTSTRQLSLSPAGEAHAVGLDLGPGEFGIRWEWPA